MVPSADARIVAKKPMMTEFLATCIQVALFQKSHQNAAPRSASGFCMPKVMSLSYQRMLYPSGSKVSIFSVKVKYGSALKLSGITMMIGAIRNRKISPQITR